MFAEGKIQGTFSFPFQIPKKPNMKLLGFVHDPQMADPISEITEGVRLDYAGESVTGKLLVLDAGTFYECQFLSENGQAANDLQNKRLSELQFATDYQSITTGPGSENNARNLARAVNEGGWPKWPYVVFPFYNPNYFGGNAKVTGHFIANETLNETFDLVDYVRPKVNGWEGSPRELTILAITGTFINGETVLAAGGGSGQIATGLTNGNLHIISGPNGAFTGTITGVISGATGTITASNSRGIWPARYWQAPAVYVFAIFEGLAKELGYELVTELVNDTELISLVLLTGRSVNYELESTWSTGPSYPWHITFLMPGFQLKDYIPDWSVSEFLNEFQTFWGFVSEFDPNKKQYLLYTMRQLLSLQPDEDWTGIVERIYGNEVRQTEATTVTFTVDENDTAVPILSPLARRQVNPDLPPDDGIRSGDIYLNEDGYWYEYYTNLSGTLSERVYSFDVGELLVPGRVPVLLKSKCSIMPTDTDNPLAIRMPRMEAKGNIEGFDVGNSNSYVPRLLFYRGLYGGDEVLGDLYPYASTDEFDPEGSDVYDYSLKLSGPKGIHTTWMADFLAFKSRTSLVKRRVLLKAGRVFSIDLKRRKLINGSQYYIKHIDVTLPLTGLAEAEFFKY